MPRIRTFKPGLFQSEDVSMLPLRARWTWLGLWTQCDDHGRTKDNVKLIKANVWPLDEVNLRDIADDLDALADHKRIVRYEVDNRLLLAVVNWHRHQSINRPGSPQLPSPPVPMGTPAPGESNHCPLCWSIDESLRTHGTLTADSRQERKGREGKGRDARERASPPFETCSKHRNDPDPPPCGACGKARKHRAEWLEDQRKADITIVRACRFCDADGNAYEIGTRRVASPYVRCEHP